MNEVDALVVPTDLEDALESQPPAAENFASSAASYRRNLLRWVKLAKKPETRAKRIEKIVAFARRNDRIPQM